MTDGRRSLHREIVDELSGYDGVLRTAIPDASDVERMGVSAACSPTSPRTGARGASTRGCGRSCTTASGDAVRQQVARAAA